MTCIKKMLRARIVLMVVLMLLIPRTGPATVIKNVRFADTVIVGQTMLKVRGVAVLKWAMLFDVYAGAFYLPESYPAQDWEKDIPKRLELAYFREIRAADIVDSSDQLLERNLSAGEYQAIEERLKEFLRLFRDVKPGDRYGMTYTPGRGTELTLNEKPLGVIPGADFAAAYFGIWLGKNPINQNFRDGLMNN